MYFILKSYEWRYIRLVKIVAGAAFIQNLAKYYFMAKRLEAYRLFFLCSIHTSLNLRRRYFKPIHSPRPKACSLS